MGRLIAVASVLLVGCTPWVFERLDAVGEPLSFDTLARGSSAGAGSCGIGDGVAWCWGAEPLGTLALRESCSSPCSSRPVPVYDQRYGEGGRVRYTSIASGESARCAIDETSEVWCWGTPIAGGRTAEDLALEETYLNVPRRVPLPASAWQQVVVGSGFACALDADGVPWCWGDPTVAVLGEAGRDTFGGGCGEECGIAPRARDDLGPWVEMAAGYLNLCGITADGVVTCTGQLGLGVEGLEECPVNGTGSPVPCAFSPVTVPTANPALEIAASTTWTCVAGDGPVQCWDPLGTPADLRASSGATGIAVGYNVCASAPDELRCWEGTWADPFLPGAGLGLRGPSAGQTTCALDGSGAAWCWGDGSFGGLGIGDQDAGWADAPVAVGGPWKN